MLTKEEKIKIVNAVFGIMALTKEQWESFKGICEDLELELTD